MYHALCLRQLETAFGNLAAQKLGFPFVSAYLDAVGTNFYHGASFATGGSTIQPLDGKMFEARYSPISLNVQLAQFAQLKARANEGFAEGWDILLQRKSIVLSSCRENNLNHKLDYVTLSYGIGFQVKAQRSGPAFRDQATSPGPCTH